MTGQQPQPELDAKFFSEVLGAPIDDVEVAPLGQSFFGQALRCLLTYSPDFDDSGFPESVTVKLPSPDPYVAATLWAEGAYRGEVNFYNQLASEVPVRVPKIWLAEYDAEAHRFVEVMEDLSDLEHLSDIEGCTFDQAIRVLDDLALLHFHFWGGYGLPDWVRPETERSGFTSDVCEGAERAADRLTGIVDDEVIAFTRSYGSIYPRLVQRLDEAPITLTHGDMRVENVFFGPDSVTIIDWDTVGRRRGIVDVAYFLALSLHTDHRRSKVSELLDRYLDRLGSLGVSTPDREQLRGSFRDATLAGWGIIVHAVSHTDIAADGAWQVLSAASKRYQQALLDVGLS